MLESKISNQLISLRGLFKHHITYFLMKIANKLFILKVVIDVKLI